MGSIQTNIGLITGLPISDTVDQLMSINSQQRDLLVSRSQRVSTEQIAVNELTASVLTFQVGVKALDNEAIYESKSATSSNPNALSATITGEPAAGSYQFTTVKQAQTHQLLSSGVASLEEPLGEGQFKFQFGGFIDSGVELSELNGGSGIQLGRIRITDRSGSSGIVDLRFAHTVDDVLEAINNNDDIDITATTVGDSLRLTDNTGQTTSNLKVQEVDSGSTAADLGLLGINVANSTALGNDIVSYSSETSIDALNQGNGVSLRSSVPELDVTLSDGTVILVDFLAEEVPDDFAEGVTTAANGTDARVRLTAKTEGGDYDGVTLQFVDDAGVTQGAETVDFDAENKILTVNIDAGNTTAEDVEAAINGDSAVNVLFDAAAIGTGLGVVDVADTATTSGGAGSAAGEEQTLGDLIDTINAANPAKLSASLDASGDRIVLTDLTGGAGSFTVVSALDGEVAEDLGLTGTAVGGVITGGKLHSGLKSSLLSNLNGGQGLGTLGNLDITDRSGASATVDLSSAETLDEVIDLVNQAGLGIEASVNSSGNGLSLRDTTGGSNNLIVANNADATETASKLQIEIDSATNSVDSESLNLQTIHENTKLADLRGGLGINEGSFIIQDSQNSTAAVSINSSVETVGDLIDAINARATQVTARINDAGDGIVLEDTAGGTGKLEVRETQGGSVASQLGILGESVTVDNQEVIDGSFGFSVELDDDDTLNDLVDKINDLGIPVSASVFSDGSGSTPHRLSLRSGISGKAGELLVDSSGTDLTVSTITSAQDAAVKFGDFTGVLVTSSSNSFSGIIDGLTFQVGPSTGETVEISVDKSASNFVAAANQFVDLYNKLVDTKETLAFYEESDGSKGVLFGTNEILRVETELTNLLSGRFFGVGDIRSLEELGISLDDQGKLSVDETQLRAKFNEDTEAVKEFFTKEDSGVAKKFDAALEQLAGTQNSLLVSRSRSLQFKIDVFGERVDNWNVRLERQREALLKEFYNLELAIGKLQNNLTAVSGIQAVPPLSATG